MTKHIGLFAYLLLLTMSQAASWSIFSPSQLFPGQQIKTAFARADQQPQSYVIYTTHFNGLIDDVSYPGTDSQLRLNASMDPSIAVQGSGQSDYLTPPDRWGLWVNHHLAQNPLTLAPYLWQASMAPMVGISFLSPETFYGFRNGGISVNTQLANTYRANEISIHVDSQQRRHTQLWLQNQNHANGWALWADYLMGDTQRQSTSGHGGHWVLTYAQQSSHDRQQGWLMGYDGKREYNQTIPYELYQVAPNAYYASPNVMHDKHYLGQWQRQTLLNDDTFWVQSLAMSIDREHGELTHPLNVTSSCGSFSDTLCLGGAAILNKAGQTLSPSDVGTPRAYALEALPEQHSQQVDVAQHIEVSGDHQSHAVGIRAHWANTDLTVNHYLASLDATRHASILNDANGSVQLGGTQASPGGSKTLTAFSPVDAKQTQYSGDVFGHYQWTLTKRWLVHLMGQWQHTYYTTKDHANRSGFSGRDVSKDYYFQSLNPAIGMTYALDPQWVLFGQVYQLSQPPSPQMLACSRSDQPCYWPTGFSQAGDLNQVVDRGIQWGTRQYGHYIQADWAWSAVARLQRRYDDIILMPTDWMQGYASNVDQTERLALNVSGQWHQAKWDTYVGYQYQQAYYASDFTAPEAYGSGNQTVRSGDALSGMPAHQARLSIGYHWLPNLISAFDWQGVSPAEYFGNFTENRSNDSSGQWQHSHVPGYGILGLRINHQPWQQVVIEAKVNNLFNKHYYNAATYGQAPTNAFVPMAELGDTGTGSIQGISDARFVMPGQERTYSLAMKWSF
jgi:hypothetical protein